MKMVRPSVIAAVLLLPVLAFAHGGGKHLLGTVKSVEGKDLTIETRDKKEVKVTIDDQTKVEKSGAPAAMKDLEAGERVVVHTAKPDKSGGLRAVLVRFGAPAAPAHPAAHDHHSDEVKKTERP